jgi:hypothetical protein
MQRGLDKVEAGGVFQLIVGKQDVPRTKLVAQIQRIELAAELIRAAADAGELILPYQSDPTRPRNGQPSMTVSRRSYGTASRQNYAISTDPPRSPRRSSGDGFNGPAPQAA